MTEAVEYTVPSHADRLAAFAPDKLYSLAGKTVLVTGASSGMGEAIALAAAAAGARVIGVARRAERLQSLADAHPAIVPMACDLSTADARSELAAKAGHVDVLVNVAGTVQDVVPAEQESAAQIAATLELNLLAPFHLAQLFEPGMREAGGGSIVNIASISGVVGIGRIPQAAYVASKSGLVGLTRELAGQWGRWGVRVNSIAAGFFRSDMTVDMFAHPKMSDWVRKGQPMPFTAVPDDFVGTVLLLSSNAGRFITGQTYAVDGGWTCL